MNCSLFSPFLYSPAAVTPVTMDAYVTRFQWDNARFPPKQPVPNLVDIISKIANDIDVEFKRKTASYNNTRVQLQAMERKAV